MSKEWPVGVLTLTIWVYWSTVFLLVFYKRVRHGQKAGVFPRQRRERRLWLGVVPVFVLWNALPFLAATLNQGPFSLPAWAESVPAIFALRSVAAVLAVLCYLASLSCWLLMGRNWSMAIVPNQKTELVTAGLFGLVRHPIYSLSILMMVCSAVVVSNAPMFFVAMLHIVVMNFKAKNEERFLSERHGDSYGNYCQKVGRFVPRLRGLISR